MQGGSIKEAKWMRQKHEVEQFHDFESIESELDRGHLIRERTATSSLGTGVTMLRPPHFHITKVKSEELEMYYSEQFSYTCNAMGDYNKEEQMLVSWSHSPNQRL